jgi:hypothetical protein
MRALRILGLLAAAASSGACFQMTTALKVNADGSGTIEHRMVYTAAGLARLRQFASLGDGRGVDPLSEQQAREMTASIGPGVTYVSSELITSAAGTGRATTYAFTDVSTLQISTQPAAPGGLTIRSQGLSTESEKITFSLSRAPGGNAVLQINVPEPNFVGALGSPNATAQIGMIKSALAGARVLLMVEPAGTVVRSSSPYIEGSRVTLLEFDLDEVLKDQTLLPRLQKAATEDEAKAIIKDAPGLKINLDRAITIEFTPAR